MTWLVEVGRGWARFCYGPAPADVASGPTILGPPRSHSSGPAAYTLSVYYVLALGCISFYIIHN